MPQKVPFEYYSVEETLEAIRILEESLYGTESQELCGDVGMELPPTQPTVAEKRGTKRGPSPQSPRPSKRRALAGCPGVAGGKRPPQ